MGEFGDESEQGAVGILFLYGRPRRHHDKSWAFQVLLISRWAPSWLPSCRLLSAWFWATSSRCPEPAGPRRQSRDRRHRISARCVREPFELYRRRGISGILLGLVTLFVVGPITFVFKRLCGGNGKAAVACSTIAGTAMTTPVALAEVAPRLPTAPLRTAQIATAVIITAIMAPIPDRLGRQEVLPRQGGCRLPVSRP